MTNPFCRPFQPHWLLRGPHAQTLAGAFLPSHRQDYRAVPHCVMLDDGDQIVLHDDCPPNWQQGERTALLIHGLAGSHESGYMCRIADKLARHGVRAFRMDLRGCGAGVALARLPYHSGRSPDAAAALDFIARIAPNSPTTLIGFSLGANIVLKLLGEIADQACGGLDSAVAVCPPIDLSACSQRISHPSNRRYDRYFVKLLLKQLGERSRARPDAASVPLTRPPTSLWDFDNEFTAVVCDFGTAEDYYRQASAAPWMRKIQIPTLVLSSRDDPLVPCAALENIVAGPGVQIHISEHGGHLGFVGRGGGDPDRRWMDWRVVDWVLAQGRSAVAELAPPPAGRRDLA